MHAVDAVEALPSVRAGDDLLSAARAFSRHRMPGLIVTDERGEVVGGLSSIDLLRLALPRYLQEEPGLARVFDEEHADRIAATLAGARVGDVVGEAAAGIPVVRPQATVVELAELMVQWSCPLAIVVDDDGRTLGIATANRLVELLVAAAESTPR